MYVGSLKVSNFVCSVMERMNQSDGARGRQSGILSLYLEKVKFFYFRLTSYADPRGHPSVLDPNFYAIWEKNPVGDPGSAAVKCENTVF